MSDDTSNAAVLKELRLLPIGELRSRAAKLFGVQATKEMTKEDILKSISAKMNSTTNFALEATGDRPAPGWARIMLHQTPGDPRFEMVSVNGYSCRIPKDVKIDVPHKVVNALRTCKKHTLVQDNTEAVDSDKFYSWQELDAFQITVFDVVDGPDPRPGHEVKKEAKLRPFRAFAAKYGYWPTPAQVRSAVTDGRLEGFQALDVDAPVLAAVD